MERGERPLGRLVLFVQVDPHGLQAILQEDHHVLLLEEELGPSILERVEVRQRESQFGRRKTTLETL